MKGVTFGKYHSYRDFGLILNSKEIAAPKPKATEIDIPGADGRIDLTEFFGRVNFENCIHKFQFSTIVPQKQFLTIYSAVKSAIHGQKAKIVLDDDPGFFYVGRLYVSSFTSVKGIGTVSIEADCEPYKYKAERTVVTRSVSGAGNIVLTNSRKRAVPVVTITAENTIRIEYKSNIWDLSSGSYTLPELELIEGDNVVAVTGTGSVSFTWQEASL